MEERTMPRIDHTEIACILDRSGSMGAIRSDAIGGFNTFLAEQRKLPGTADLTLVLFDDEYEVPIKKMDLKDVEPLNEATYVPRGSTALLDAIGRTINDVDSRIMKDKEEDRPEKVIVAILTDGMENASKEFTKDQIKGLIEKQQNEKGWDFIFLAANQDAFHEAGQIGIHIHLTSNFRADKEGTRDAFTTMNKMISTSRMARPKKRSANKGYA